MHTQPEFGRPEGPVSDRALSIPPALNTKQAARYTGLAVATLEGFRTRGGGPHFVRYSRRAVRYLLRDLDQYMLERTVANTSEVHRGV